MNSTWHGTRSDDNLGPSINCPADLGWYTRPVKFCLFFSYMFEFPIRFPDYYETMLSESGLSTEYDRRKLRKLFEKYLHMYNSKCSTTVIVGLYQLPGNPPRTVRKTFVVFQPLSQGKSPLVLFRKKRTGLMQPT